jgi:integrase
MSLPLLAIATRYCECHILAVEYQKTLLRTAKNCQRFQSVNVFLRYRLETVKPITVSNDRAMLLILLRWAYDEHLIEEYPRGIAKIKASREPTRAWTLEQCWTAVKCSRNWRGISFRSGADKGDFLECWLRLGYATGARYSDLMKLSRRHLEGSRLYYSQNKTGSPINAVLDDDAMAAVNAMLARSPDGRILGWACQKRWAMRLMKRLLVECRLDGSSKWLRRSAATHVEQKQKGAARLFLGHKTNGLAERFYVDWGQVKSDIPSPPRLVEQ